MNAKQQRFVNEYLIDLNATQAAVRAGYSAKTAKQIGARLLTYVDVSEAITNRQAELAENAGVTQERIVRELSMIGFADMRKFAAWGPDGVELVDSQELDDAAAGCVAEVAETVTKEGGSKRFKLHDKVSALTLLGKHLGLFPDRHELSVRHTGPLVVRFVRETKP